MKKVINLILCLIMVLSVGGCSQKNTAEKTAPTQEKTAPKIKDAQKTTIQKTTPKKTTAVHKNTAPKAKETQVQDGKTNVKEKAKSKENTKKKEDELILKGKIVGYAGGSDSGNTNTIVLDEKLKIYGREIDRVWLKNDIITDLIPRKYMTYYLEGGEALKEELIEKIPIEVKVDPNSFEFVDFYTFAKGIKVVSLDGESNPRDKSEDEYSIDYYKAVFYAICSDNVNYEYPCPADIKEYYFYKNPDTEEFKIAVDKILESGLYINMLEGEYVIETEKRYSEEGVGK